MKSPQEVLLKNGYLPFLFGEGIDNFLNACNHNNAVIVRAYLDMGMSPNTITSAGNTTALIKAVEGNALDVMKILIEAGAALETKDGEGDTALFTAVNWQHFDAAKLLVEKGADINTTSVGDGGILEKCIEKDRLEGFEFALALGADPDFNVNPDSRPIGAAIADNKVVFVQKLLEAGASPNAITDKANTTAFMDAVMKGNVEIIHMMIEAGADLLHKNQYGWNAQMACREYVPDIEKTIFKTTLTPEEDTICQWFNYVENGNISGMQEVLKNGMSVNQEYVRGGNAAIIALRAQNAREVLECLADYGIDMQAENVIGRNIISVLYNLKRELLGFALDHGVSPNNSNKFYVAIRYAAKDGDEENVKLLLEHGADANYSFNGWCGLHSSAKQNKPEMAKLFLKHGADPNQHDSHGETPLHTASRRAHTEVARLLLEHGANINFQDNSGQTPLIAAIDDKERDTEVFGQYVTFLLENGADLSLSTKYGNETAYEIARDKNSYAQWAIENYLKKIYRETTDPILLKNTSTEVIKIFTYSGELDLVDKILNAGASVIETRSNVRSPLYVACFRNNKELVEMFLNAGAEADNGALYNRTPLQISCENGEIEIATLLLVAGANPNHIDDYFGGPFRGAASKNQVASIQLLEKYGLNFDQYPSGYSPLMSACRNGHLEMVKYLVEEKKCPPYSRDERGYTPLTCAVLYNHPEIVKLLISYGSPVEYTSIDGEVPLVFAVFKEYREIARMLVDAGANLAYSTNGKKSPWEYAEERESMREEFASEIEAIKKSGIKVTEKKTVAYEPFGMSVSPLFDAIHYCNFEKVKQLLEEGADVNERNHWGETPLMIAAANTDIPVVNLLIEKGADVNAKNKFNELLSSYSLEESVRGILENAKAEFGLYSLDSINATAARSLREDKLKDAIQNGDLDAIEESILSGQVSAHFFQYGVNPWYMAFNKGSYTSLQRLMKIGMPIELKDKNGYTPLFYAAEKDLKSIKLFVEAGANVNHINNHGQNCLYRAVNPGMSEAVKYLVEKGADPTYKYPLYGSGLLHWAIDMLDLETIEFALSLINVNEPRANGNTALHDLMGRFNEEEENTKEAIKMVLAAGADHFIENNEGHTARYIAEYYIGENETLLEFLDSVNIPSVEEADRIIIDNLNSKAKEGDEEAAIAYAKKVWRTGYEALSFTAYKYVLKYELNPEANYLRAKFLSRGFGCEEDRDESLNAYRKAGEQGHVLAMFEAYELLSRGSGVPENKTEAAQWCLKGAESGHIPAMSRIAEIYEHGIGVDKDEALAVKWYQSASERDDISGHASLAVMYALGKGVPASMEKAKEYYTLARGFYWDDLLVSYGLDKTIFQ